MGNPALLLNKDKLSELYEHAVSLLTSLIEAPSFSKEEGKTAQILEKFLRRSQVNYGNIGYNIFALPNHYDPKKPILLLNSHHDTVKPNPNYTRNPFKAEVEGGKLYGLGSNDAGGCLVSLIATFLFFTDQQNLSHNIILVASAEEEISGSGGIEYLLSQPTNILPFDPKKVDFAIVGEPTLLQLAIAERGLMVVDGVYTGKAGHAAREEGVSALLKFVKDVHAFDATKVFTKVSAFLGPVKVSPTVAFTENKAHNVVPTSFNFVLDCRINELYTFTEVMDLLQESFHADLRPRSMRLRSSIISPDHPLVVSGIKMGKKTYGSPTTSDKALMPFPALKMGPGDSARSHTADEFIYLNEIRDGIKDYIHIISKTIG